MNKLKIIAAVLIGALGIGLTGYGIVGMANAAVPKPEEPFIAEYSYDIYNGTSGVAAAIADCLKPYEGKTVPKEQEVVREATWVFGEIEKPVVEDIEEIDEVQEIDISEDEFDLLCRCVQAEAGNQSFEGKRLVACVILNRVDVDGWGDSITEVITAKNQFATWPRMIQNADVSDDTIEAVTAELGERSNPDIIAFRTGHYHSWCTPWKKVGDHYFSK